MLPVSIRASLSLRWAALAAAVTILTPVALTRDWVPASGPEGENVVFVSASPVKPGVIFVRTWFRLYRSSDGGQTWTRMTETSPHSSRFAYDPHEANHVWAVAHGWPSRSLDSGETWTPVDGPFESGIESQLDVAFDPDQPRRIFAVAGTKDRPSRLYRSDDWGGTWTAVHDFGSFPAEHLTMPAGSSLLLVGTSDGILRSTDAGNTFRPVYPGFDVHTLRLNPNVNGRVWAIGAQGLLLSVDGGANWRPRPLPIEVGWQTTFSVAGADVERLVVANLYEGIWVSEDQGASWLRIENLPIAFQSADVSVSPWNSSVLLATDDRGLGVYRSTDGGASWSPSSSGLRAKLGHLAVHPHPAGPILAFDLGGHLFVDREHAGNWEALDASPAESNFGSLALSPFDPNRIVVAYRPDGQFSTQLRLRSSVDGGRTWQRITPPRFQHFVPVEIGITGNGTLVLSSHEGQWITRNDGADWYEGNLEKRSVLVPDPRQPSWIWAVGQQGIRRSVDSGLTWESSVLPLRVRKIQFHPTRPSWLYAAGHAMGPERTGLYTSFDGGRHWTAVRAQSGLPAGTSRSVALDPDRPQRVAVLDSDGIPYLSLDGGRSFEDIRGSLQPLPSNGIAFDTRNGTLWGLSGQDRLIRYRP